jgi:AmiR/NasT family two-component response regulator
MSQPKLEALRIVVVAPDLAITDPDDTHAMRQAERSRSLRIALLENGFNLVAILPADTFLQERLGQLQADLAEARTELMDLSAELKNRRIIERAKGLLMQRPGLSEQVAYEKLRKTAMYKNLKVVDVAQRMLDVAELLG